MPTSASCILDKSQEIYWRSLRQPLIVKEGLSFVSTGIPSPWMNEAMSPEVREDNAARLVKEAFHFFGEKEMPFSWWMAKEEIPEAFEEEFRKHGGANIGCFEGMVFALDGNIEGQVLPGFEVHAVTGESALNCFVDVLVKAYDAPPTVSQKVFNLLKAAGFNLPVLHFLGALNGAPVSVGTLIVEGHMAGIFHVGTVPEARNRGYATSLMQRVLRHAQEIGCRQSFLTSTPEANALYRRIGYKRVKDFHLFMAG